MNVIRYFYKEGNSILVLSSRFLIKKERQMKKFLCILFIFVFVSSASAAVYKWVDERGVVNYADDYSKVPPDYGNKVEEVSITRMGPSTPSRTPLGNMSVGARSGNTSTQAPPIAQPLIREGDFAIKLAEALKVGQAKSEAEAESMLASVGIAPKNGWIADYPITPDIAEELQNAISQAADSKRLSLSRDEALIAFQGLTAEMGLSFEADTSGEVAQNDPPADYGQYSNPDVINNYYYDQGPPVVTYYPPPWDYYYLYAWVPYPFWCSGFFFPGYFVLNDFNIIVVVNIRGHHHHHKVTNHFIDPKTHKVLRVDPKTKVIGRADKISPSRFQGFNSTEARKGATSIFERSYKRSRSGNAPDGINPTRSGGRFEGGYSANRGNNLPVSNSRTSGSERPSATWRNRSEAAPRSSAERPSSQQRGFEGPSRAPSTSSGRSFTPPSTGSRSSSGSSFRAPSMDGNRSFTTPSTGSRGSYGGSFRASQEGGRSGSFGGDRFSTR